MKITLRMTLVLTVLAALLLAGSNYTSWQLAEDDVLLAAQRRARMLAEVIKLAAESDLRDHGQLGAIVDRVAREGDERIVFYDAAGHAIAPVPTEEDPAVFGRIREVIERRRPSSEVFNHADLTVVVYRTPLFTANRRAAGALELRMELDEAPPRATHATGTGLQVALLLLFGALVWLTSWRWIGRPIRQLRDGMDHVIRGDLTHVLPLDHREEIGRIAYRFNEMTARLRAAQDEIRDNADTKLQLESRLRRSEKLATIGQLSAEIAHEVGTPLNVIGGRAATLQRKADQPHIVRKNAQIITDQVTRIARIIEQVLDLGRGPRPRQEEVDVVGLVDEAISLLEYQSQMALVRIERATGPSIPSIVGDPDGIRQVVLNLLVNAVQAMPAGGQVLVSLDTTHRRKGGLDLAPPEHYLAISVADQGHGIAPHHREHIFDPFFTTKTKGEGTGLGLTVVHGLVKAHDGWIEVDEVQPTGTLVTVFLPVGSTDDAVQAAPTSTQATNQTHAVRLSEPTTPDPACDASKEPGR